ncbi:putative membrane protein [Enterococcus sp. PF1-24]|uniref:hypothetical protein n=1 Tax=unclassified Enterococcus TaxID=2608891 RepID=UPI0024755369|nr:MULTISPECIES: hypothetical protein [unclassified Enterococcus]MDH6364849.1 putative membrane protein [Enterococcus sp. PFB1-1]MDH6401927.1 putative membrane protein [Enterococcus sp. PF1-24]
MLTARNKIALLMLMCLFILGAAHFSQTRVLVLLALGLLAVALGYSSWQVGVKHEYSFLAIDLGAAWGRFVSLLMLVAAIGVAVFIIYATLNSAVPLKY